MSSTPTGVRLARLEISTDAVYLRIEQDSNSIYATRFTGRGGVLLAERVGLATSYEVQGDEGYVRATVRSSSGAKAWTQPMFMR